MDSVGDSSTKELLTRRRYNDIRTGKAPGQQAFACPFYRKDPVNNMDCVARKLRRIKDVKQHIQRRHFMYQYCPRCFTVPNRQSLCEHHIREGNSKVKPPPTNSHILAGSEEALALSSYRVDRKEPPQHQWLRIWNIIFNSTSKLPNPYLGTVSEETIGMFRDYYTREAHSIVRDILTKKQISTVTGVDEISMLVTNVVDEAQEGFKQKVQRLEREESPEIAYETMQELADSMFGHEYALKEEYSSHPTNVNWDGIGSQFAMRVPPLQLESGQAEFLATDEPLKPFNSLNDLLLLGTTTGSWIVDDNGSSIENDVCVS
ncbi:hypothetical protein BGZ63DRAFT_405585 [Mariannaea sp. PMI_226]|nr:hypothetical protein BGZ63DRAFT_405585 [Mariannaea sp. PMI_226]